MPSNKDYSQVPLEELIQQEQKMQSRKTTTAVFVGVLLGIAVYAATHKGFVLALVLLVAAFWFGGRYAQDLKNIQAEISRRNQSR